jgi:hypothetical protein
MDTCPPLARHRTLLVALQLGASVALVFTSGVTKADDCEAFLNLDGKPYYAPRNAYDSPPLLPTATSADLPGATPKTPISSGLMKLTTTVNGVTFDSNYDNGSLFSVANGGPNIWNLGLFVEDGDPIDAQGTRKYHFRFKMTGVAGKTITLNLDHASNPRPSLSLDNGATWRRMTAAEAPTSTKMVLTFTAAAQNTAEVAFFDPLGLGEIYSRVNSTITNARAAGVQGITREVLGLSFQSREQWLVTVTDPAYPDAGKHRVWLHARAHAGEVTASHMMLGFLDQVTTDTALGRRLRRFCILNIVPCQNVDGVYLGCTRWDSQGIDPERQWGDPSRIPEVGNIRTRIDTYMAGANPIQVCLNIHSTVNDFADIFFFKHVQGAGSTVTAAYETIQQNFINAFDGVTASFDNLDPQTSVLDPVKFVESYMWNNWGQAVMAMTNEGHYYNRITDGAWINTSAEYYSATTDGLWITGTDYQGLGRSLAESLVPYFSLPVPVGMSGWELN